jgi:thiol-disulfide isomerase/thioredoxin
MKNILVLFLVLSFQLSANAQLSITINGKLNSAVNGKVYLERLNDRNIAAKLDSFAIVNQTFTIKTNIPEPGIYQVNIANDQLLGMILEGGETLSLTADGIVGDKPAMANLDGSITMTLFNEIQIATQAFQKKAQEIDTKIRAAKGLAERDNLINQYRQMSSEHRALVMPKFKQLGSSVAGIVATNNFLNPEEDKAYFLELKNKILAEKLNHNFAKMFIQVANQATAGEEGTPAPDFELTTIQGKKFKLSELKGKTVILDFWATWCGPCIMAFPGMKLAVEKYQNNPDIVFGFVNTFERVGAANWTEHVKKFVTNRGFSFMDPVLDIGNSASLSYGVNGIPAKFCIDKEGNIKHKSSGYAGSADAVLKEMTEWIEK